MFEFYRCKIKQAVRGEKMIVKEFSLYPFEWKDVFTFRVLGLTKIYLLAIENTITPKDRDISEIFTRGDG
jgi:hypothetical protein